ncbi:MULTISPECIES: SDR family oxidoreductase [Sphingomonas]|uniref:SDR family oxidoreductase n=1 Tax=Sphingomonas TaxID=13687 RepID=UPI000F7F09FC|nr:SDR family oxidoreductase [Sphingomonas sp. ABOLF]RSV14085.1 SDR family NAD(P)-dependent oxidoreductase [Sphingomonas sp. ABOLF]GLK20270.1 short-chain dehydrogenase [Microbacterium terregens]
MKAQLKPLSEQVIVITGASSGHGLETARRAAAAGARVVLIARDGDALARVRDQIQTTGGSAATFVADVGQEEEVERAAAFAIDHFGGFDTWVNNAGIGVYAAALETPTADHRQVFETNYWGVVYGSLAALRHLKEKPGGGALINVGSINSDMPSPVISSYTASKHAVKGFTDSLRLEMMAEGAPVSITLIKPGPVGTPFPQHGRNLTGYKAQLPPPLYAPSVVADAILDAAQHPRRSLTVGGVGKLQVLGAQLVPLLFDRVAQNMGVLLANPAQPVPVNPGNLYAPDGKDGVTEGEQKGRSVSAFTATRTHPGIALGAVALAGAALGLAVRARGRKPEP